MPAKFIDDRRELLAYLEKYWTEKPVLLRVETVPDSMCDLYDLVVESPYCVDEYQIVILKECPTTLKVTRARKVDIDEDLFEELQEALNFKGEGESRMLPVKEFMQAIFYRTEAIDQILADLEATETTAQSCLVSSKELGNPYLGNMTFA